MKNFKNVTFLGGTCNHSTWREKLIALSNIAKNTPTSRSRETSKWGDELAFFS